jgi:deferrochelatase/peroxidase EfeB
MTDRNKPSKLSRRGFLAGTSGIVAAGAGIGAAAALPVGAAGGAAEPTGPAKPGVEAFWGVHQAGILTPQQRHTYFAAFDLVATKREEVAALLRRWTAASARMSVGQPAEPFSQDPQAPGPDSADTMGLPPSRLTITFGFGAGLFVKDGADRYGLAAQRPEALVDMPKFPGDQLVETRSDGDLSIQACADDPQVAFHAVRELARQAYGLAQIRWVQSGFVAEDGKATPRNLMGFKDGSNNPPITDARTMDQVVWVGSESPAWIRGGSYLVVRRSRIALEHWDRMKVAFQEQTIGRRKYSGAPIGGKHEMEQPNLTAVDADGNPVIAENSHVRLAAAASNDGARILRRAYSYNDGVNITAERWPPWRQEMEFDAGLLFICYQRDPRTGFIKIFDRMSKFDMMNQFVTNTGGALFACPRGALKGEYIGQHLFETQGS